MRIDLRSLAALGIALFLCNSGWAQEAEPVQETIRQLSQQIKALQQKVDALEAEEATKASVPGPEPSQAGGPNRSLIDQLQETHGIRWEGFGEVDYKVLNQHQPETGTFGFVPGSAGNFYTGDFDLYLTSKITNHTSVLSEIVFGEQQAQSFDVDVERLLLKYDYDDHLRLSFGRYHTAIGYYNTAFHSGKWLQTTADRPLVMELAAEGGLLPTQAIGVSATGLISSPDRGLNYVLEYGSSDTVRPDIDGSGTLDEERNSNHINVGLFLRPSAIYGLQVGGSFYHDNISDSSTGSAARQGQTIVNAHVIYVANRIEFLNEGFLLRLSSAGRTFNMPAFYSQISRRVGRTGPFVRFQYVNANPADSVFDDVRLRYGPSFGARYDFTENVAFKAQLDHTFRSGKPELNGLQMQVAFAF